jgi:hypothetical protein
MAQRELPKIHTHTTPRQVSRNTEQRPASAGSIARPLRNTALLLRSLGKERVASIRHSRGQRRSLGHDHSRRLRIPPRHQPSKQRNQTRLPRPRRPLQPSRSLRQNHTTSRRKHSVHLAVRQDWQHLQNLRRLHSTSRSLATRISPACNKLLSLSAVKRHRITAGSTMPNPAQLHAAALDGRQKHLSPHRI